MKKLHTAINDNIWSQVGIKIGLDAAGQICAPLVGCQTLAAAGITIEGTLAEFSGHGGAVLDRTNISSTLDLLGLVDLGVLLDTIAVSLLAPILDNVVGPVLDLVTDDVLGNVQTILQDELLAPLLTPLLDALQPLLSKIAQITINEQPTELTPIAGVGDLGAGSFTARALSVTLLPLIPSSLLKLEFASATVLAEEPVATLTATPAAVAEGETVTLAGTFFAPNEAVTFTVDGDAWTPATAVTTDANGAFSGVAWTVPAGYSAGDTVSFTATDVSGSLSTATVTIVAPALSATDAPQGGTVNVTGSGFVPGEVVTITLPGGGTEVVNASDDGTISYAWPVPETQAIGNVTFTALGESGRTASADATISRPAASLVASPNPVAPGDTVTLTGGNFAPNETVTLTLPVVCAITGGTPVVADSAGAFTVTCAVNAGVADGTSLNFSATGNGSGRSATAATEVDSTPDAGVNANASASAAASAQANGNNEIAAQAAAQAAAMADQTSTATAVATANANAAAEAAARTNVSATASATASANATSAAVDALEHTYASMPPLCGH